MRWWCAGRPSRCWPWWWRCSGARTRTNGGEAPELVTLSALTHGSRPGGEKVLDALLAGVTEETYNYLDLVIAVLPEAARRYLEDLMTVTGIYRPQSDFAKKYFAEGEAQGEARGEVKGEAKAIMRVLAARGITVTQEARERITGCTDQIQLETWIDRAATVDSLDALFE